MITVKELIEILREYDGNAVVGVCDDTSPTGHPSEDKVYACHLGGVTPGTTLHRKGRRRYRGNGRPAVVIHRSDLGLDDGVALGGKEGRARRCETGRHDWHPERHKGRPCRLTCLHCFERSESTCGAGCVHCSKLEDKAG